MGAKDLDSGRWRSSEIPETGVATESLCKKDPLRNGFFGVLLFF